MNPKLLVFTDRRDLTRFQVQGLLQSGIQISFLAPTIVKDKGDTPNLDSYSLVLINLFDRESDSLGLCRKLRLEYNSVILVLTCNQDEQFLLRLYDAGADECLGKSLGNRLLVAKVQAWLRRAATFEDSEGYLEAYKFRFDPVTRQVKTPQDTLVRLSKLEARLLYLLMANKDRIVSTDVIVQRVWRDEGKTDGDRDVLKKLVYRLRRKLEGDADQPQFIHTIPYEGYTFSAAKAATFLHSAGHSGFTNIESV